MNNEDSRLAFQKMIACNSLAAFAHLSQEDIVNYSSVLVSLLTAITLLPKVFEIVKNTWDEWMN